MRRSSHALAGIAALPVIAALPAASVMVFAIGLAGCSIALDHEFDDSGEPSAPDATVQTVAGCSPFPAGSGVSGGARSLPLPEGGSLWVVDQATAPDGGTVLSAQFVVAPRAAADCDSWSASLVGPAFAPSPLVSAGLLAAMDLVQTDDAPALYYEAFAADASAPLGLRSLGVGLAPRDPGTGLFTPTAELLWSPDRPSYGASALRLGEVVYVYGCASSGYLSDDCYVARAAASSLASSAAYTYWTGDAWSSNPDDAAPIAEAGGGVSVRPDPTGAPQFVMTYVPPLGNTLVARTAIAPEGPWSAPTTLGTCALDGAGPGAFCGGGQQHPELARDPAAPLALTYEAQTFAADAGSGAAFLPQLVAFPVP
jgi:Domain of unknown function (DUF4185)